MFGIIKTNYTSLSDEQLMGSVLKAECKAFETLYDRYFNKLVWFARGFLADSQKSEDLVQDVFIKLIEKPEQFDGSRKFSTWIYVVTSNRCKQVLRDEKNRLRILQENVMPFTEKTATLHQTSDFRLLKEKIQVVFNDCSEKEKSIYSLRFEQELSIKEIAEILRIPEGSVKSGIYYLLKKFANHLKEFSHEH